MITRAARQRPKCSFLRNKPASQAGITLMELVVVLALLLIVLGMVYSFLSFANRSFVKSGDQFQLHTNLRSAGDLVTSEIRNATEMEILTFPFTADGASDYLYVENNTLKLRKSGTVSNVTESVLAGSGQFTVRKDSATGRYFMTINLQGSKGEEQYTVNTEILLNNVSTITGSLSGNVIRYKK